MSPPPPGLIVAAPASGSGKTVLTTALLRLLRSMGLRVAPCKLGPDYIDPVFHTAAAERACVSLDLWGMREASVLGVLADLHRGADLVLCEGAMGLFDAASDGRGSTADVAALTGWPVLLVVDARGQGASVAATVRGFRTHRSDVQIAGVLFNRVGSAAHGTVLREAVEPLGVRVLGCVPRHPEFRLPERHLGLVQALEHEALEAFLAAASCRLAACVDVAALVAIARPSPVTGRPTEAALLPPLGQRTAVARDVAFGFAYPAVLEGWRRAGVELRFFSPLADEAPDEGCDAVYLPGGYPELHAGRLAGNARFLDGLRHAAERNAIVYGECGGYMVLGRGLCDASGRRHGMADLLPVETSFAERRLHLGYRHAELVEDCGLGRAGDLFSGHEFHYATIVEERAGAPLFRCADARGRALGSCGARRGSVSGSFIHLIDRAPATRIEGSIREDALALSDRNKSGIFSPPHLDGSKRGNSDAESRADVHA